MIFQITESVKKKFQSQKIKVYKPEEKQKPKPGSTTNFLVKVQPQLIEYEAYYKRKTERSARGNRPRKHGLTLYNQDRSILGVVPPSEEIYDDLFKAGLSPVTIRKQFELTYN